MVEVSQRNGLNVLGLPEAGPEMFAENWEMPNETAQAFAYSDRSIHRHNAVVGIDLKRICRAIHRQSNGGSRAPNKARHRPRHNTELLYPQAEYERAPNYRKGPGHDMAEAVLCTDASQAPGQTALSTEIQQVWVKHGVTNLHECHSYGQVIQKRAVETVPDPNIYVGSSTFCANSVERSEYTCRKVEFSYSCVFRGFWVVQRVAQQIESNKKFQMELAQSIYLDETTTWSDHADKVDQMRPGFTVFSAT